MLNSIEFKVGLLIFFSIVVFVVLLMSASNWPLSTGKELRIHFNFVSDIQVGAVVHLAGVKIGKVTGITLLGSKGYETDTAHPDAPHDVEIKARIDKRFQHFLREGCRVTISTLGFVGESYLEVSNGPINQPELSYDKPIIGKDPLSIAAIMEEAQKMVDIAHNAGKSVLEIIAVNQKDLKKGITDFQHFIVQTSESLDKMLKDVDTLLVTLNQVTSQNADKLSQALTNANILITQAETDFARISTQLERITQTLYRFVEENEANANAILADVAELSADYKSVAKKLDADIPKLKSEISELVSQTQNALDTETPKLDKLLENLNRTTKSVEKITENAYQILDRIQRSEGTVAKLIDDPSGYEEIRETLKSAEETFVAVRQLSRKFEQKTDAVKKPDLYYDYKLRYRSIGEILRNEFALWLLSSRRQQYRLGLSVQGEDIDYEAQFGQRWGNFTARAGFIRSKIGVGFDYWLLSKRLGLTVEGINITTKTPEVDFEASLRLLPNWAIIFGTEYIIVEPGDFEGDFGFNVGIRAMY